MNFSEATIVLYPVLGQDPMRLIFSYLTVFGNEVGNTKFSSTPDRKNVHEYCNIHKLNDYNLGVYLTDVIFNEIKRTWDSGNECTRSNIQGAFPIQYCSKHGHSKYNCETSHPQIQELIESYHDRFATWSFDEMFMAFCKDIEVPFYDEKSNQSKNSTFTAENAVIDGTSNIVTGVNYNTNIGSYHNYSMNLSNLPMVLPNYDSTFTANVINTSVNGLNTSNNYTLYGNLPNVTHSYI